MAKVPGYFVRQSPQRRWIADLMRISRGLPMISFERRMNLAPVAAARGSMKTSWVLLFVKAYSIIAARRPELRRAYMSWPWPHFFEAKQSHAMLAIEREYCGEPGVFFSTIGEPDKRSLPDLQAALTHLKTEPLENIPDFHRLIRLAKLPWPIRRTLWWYAYHVFGHVRGHNYGTFGISVTASGGATALNLISPVATTLSYGLFDNSHSLDVRLHFDHRVIDGMTAAKVLAEVEEVLNTQIAGELQNLLRG